MKKQLRNTLAVALSLLFVFSCFVLPVSAALPAPAVTSFVSVTASPALNAACRSSQAITSSSSAHAAAVSSQTAATHSASTVKIRLPCFILCLSDVNDEMRVPDALRARGKSID